MMIADFFDEIRNYFEVEKYIERITISNGALQGFSDRLQNNQYFRIVGSVFNDGVYKYNQEGLLLIDEIFHGAVWAMAVPPNVIALINEIQTWDTKYGNSDAANSPFQSESFGGYSYSKGSSGSSGGGGAAVTWQGQFGSRLNKYRKI